MSPVEPTNLEVEDEWRGLGPDPLTAPLRAALEVFARHGYHGSSIRSIAEASGLSVPGLYHHYPSKQALLRAIVDTTMAEMLEHTRAAEADSDGTPTGRLSNLVESLVRFHIARRDHSFVASTEMRSMEPDVRAHHIVQRDEQQTMIAGAVSDGVEAGEFTCDYPADAARAISSLCVSIASWYRPDGPLTPDQIVDRHLAFALGMVGASR